MLNHYYYMDGRMDGQTVSPCLYRSFASSNMICVCYDVKLKHKQFLNLIYFFLEKNYYIQNKPGLGSRASAATRPQNITLLDALKFQFQLISKIVDYPEFYRRLTRGYQALKWMHCP